MSTFNVWFLSPDRQISFNEVLSLSVNGLEGELVILANHSPYLIYLLPGIITVKINNKQANHKIVIDNGGVLEIATNCSIVANQIQIFDRFIHNEKSFKDKKVCMYLSYLDSQ